MKIGLSFLRPAQCAGLFSLLVLGLALLAMPVRAEWDPRLTHGRLENGLTYILHDSGKAEDPFNIRLIVHAGSVDEDIPSGAAHSLEHMVFQTTHGHPETLHRYIQEIGWRTGLQVNAVTRETETQYMIRTRPQDALDLDGALALAADIAFGARLEADDWERERRVILEELRQGESVADRINRQKKELLRIGSRYTDRPTIGTRDGIEKTTVEDLRAFHRRFYVASNMTLIVSGRFDAPKAEATIRKAFGQAPAMPRPPRPYLALPLKDGLTTGIVQDPKGTSSQVTYAFRLPMPDRASAEGQFAYLKKYLLNKLVRDAVERRPVVENLGMVMQETTENRLILAFSARTADHEATLPRLLETVERLRRDGLSREAFEKELAAMRRINGNNVKAASRRTFAEWEDRIASAVLIGTELEAPQARADRTRALIDRLDFDDLNATLRAMLAAPDRVLFYQLAGTAAPITPDAARIEAERLRLAALDSLPPLPDKPARRKDNDAPLPVWPAEAVLPAGGAPVAAAPAKNPALREWRLSNGDRIVWLARDTPDGKVYLSGQSHPGYDNAEFGGTVSQAGLQLWVQSGFRFWPQAQYDRWRKAQPADWTFALQDGRLDVAAAVLPAHLPELLRRYAATVAFGTVRDEAAAEFNAQMASAPAGKDDYTRLLYVPPGASAAGAVAKERLEAAAGALLAQPVTWFAVGPAPDAALLDAFGKTAGGVPRAATLTARPTLQRPGVHRKTVETPAGDRARVRLSFFTPLPWTPEAAFLISSLTPLTQQALKNELRHTLGGVYTLSFEMELDPDSNRVTGSLSFHCAPERAEALADAALKVLRAMPGIAAGADTQRLRADIDFAERTRRDDANTQLRRLALSYVRYDDAGYLDRAEGLSARLTPALLEAQARRIFATENTAILIERPKPSSSP